MDERKRVRVLDILVDVIDMDIAIDRVESWIRQRKKSYICVVPVSTIVEAVDDKDYRRIINNADMVTPDGMPIVWSGRFKGHSKIKRVCGPDFMKKICKDPCLAHWKHFFLGTTPATLKRLERKLRQWNPDIQVCGSYAPPVDEKARAEDESIIAQINGVQPDILWVGMGAPKQDYWMKLNRERLDVPVMIGVGAAFDFLAGVKPRAPEWMQRIGMEWFFRLCCEPRRLWRRYVIGNARFCFEMFKEIFRLRNVKS
ncbi:MAG: WecB/TagA/CpsF family glycosyltransferase [Candidatus Omnitrophota bacterium]